MNNLVSEILKQTTINRQMRKDYSVTKNQEPPIPRESLRTELES